MVAHHIDIVGVVGSSPASPTIIERGISLFFLCVDCVVHYIELKTVRVPYLMGSGTQILYLKFYLQLFCANI